LEEIIHRGEIYLIDLYNGAGSEQNGVRPAVVVQNEIGNQHSPTTIVCPLTTKAKRLSITHANLSRGSGVLQDSVVLCEQIRVIDKSRILKRLGEISPEKLNEINQKIMISLGIGA